MTILRMMQVLKLNSLACVISWFHILIIATIYVFLGIKAFFEFKPQWDYLAYHLPFALRHYELTSYTPWPFIEQLYGSIPPLPHLISGLLVKVTGKISASTGINFIALIGLASVTKWLYPKFSLTWFLTALLTIPLVIIHIPSGYIDFWTATFCSMMFIGGFAYCSNPTIKAAFISYIGAFGATFSKYQSWPFVFLLTFVIGLILLFYHRKQHRLKSSFVYLAILIVIVLAFPFKNWIQFQNPMHPWPPPFISQYLSQKPAKLDLSLQRPQWLKSAEQPQLFFYSITEATRFMYPGYSYSLDQGFPEGYRSPHFRLGGWGFHTVLLLITAGMLFLLGKRKIDMRVSFLLTFLGLLFFIPQNHELRYWLMIPIPMMFLICLHLNELDKAKSLLLKALILVCAVYSLSQTKFMFSLDLRKPHERAPQEAQNFWVGKLNSDEVYEVCGKLEQTIYWSGPNFNEIKVKACP